MNNTGITILSILIPTIPSRYKQLKRIKYKLFVQVSQLEYHHPMLGCVEIMSNNDKPFLEGGLSIGKKREELSQQATGKFQCQLDDDEDIAPNYVETLLRLCQQNVDVVTFRSFIKNDFYWGIVDMSLKNLQNEEATPERIVKRLPWHICPIRSDIAKRHSFPHINYSEDAGWMEKVLPDCKSEAHTDQVLHQYNHSSKHSEADKIVNADKIIIKPNPIEYRV